MIRLPDPCLVVLVGAPGAGKSYWAEQWFESNQIVSSDGLRRVGVSRAGLVPRDGMMFRA